MANDAAIGHAGGHADGDRLDFFEAHEATSELGGASKADLRLELVLVAPKTEDAEEDEVLVEQRGLVHAALHLGYDADIGMVNESCLFFLIRVVYRYYDHFDNELMLNFNKMYKIHDKKSLRILVNIDDVTTLGFFN